MKNGGWDVGKLNSRRDKLDIMGREVERKDENLARDGKRKYDGTMEK